MKTVGAAVLGLLALMAIRHVAAESPSPSSCLIQPDKAVPITPSAGRAVYCGLDIGSKTVKLSVVSMAPGRNTTLKDERQCKRTLGMGALVFDSTTSVARPLPEPSIVELVDTIREYQQICAVDHGSMVSAGATQWARDATNITEVARRVQSATGVTLDVLSPEQEAIYSYVAASLGAPGRIVLDPGSNSFELAWQPRDSKTISSILVPYGYVRAATNDVEPAVDYAAATAAYQARARTLIDQELGKLDRRMSLAALRQLVKSGAIGPEIVALGQDGAVELSVRGRLRTPNRGWVADASSYDAILARQTFSADPAFGIATAAPLSPAEIAAYLSDIRQADFRTLTTDPVRAIYGQKALVVPALVDLLLKELSASRLVMVPQEMASGHILSKLPR